MATAAYHELELAIAQNRRDPANNLPELPTSYERVLDVGCGHGQTLKALGIPAQKGYGIDLSVPDSEYFLVAGRGESLPFPDQHFDFIYSRVSLPYMDIPKALAEMRRVLKPGCQLWLSLHGWPSLRRRVIEKRDFIYCGYVALNSLLLHLGILLPWKGNYESIQTVGSITRALKLAGFLDVAIKRGNFFEVLAS
jgi:SAM-dependent methyltransferase